MIQKHARLPIPCPQCGSLLNNLLYRSSSNNVNITKNYYCQRCKVVYLDPTTITALLDPTIIQYRKTSLRKRS
jgi:Zn-finger nucleic acid-binding protein